MRLGVEVRSERILASEKQFILLGTNQKALRELERFYGIDPLSRLRLGLTLVDTGRAVDSLKAPVAPEER